MIQKLNQLSKIEKPETEKCKPSALPPPASHPKDPWTKKEAEAVAIHGIKVWANFFWVSENGIYVRYIPISLF